MIKWKLKLNFVNGLPNLEKEVNRIYHNAETLINVIKFYSTSGLLKNGNVEIEIIEESEENKFSF